MGSGAFAVDASFAGASKRPDFTVDIRLEDLELRTVNDFLQAENDLRRERGAAVGLFRRSPSAMGT
jgi:hypothetical protein